MKGIDKEEEQKLLSNAFEGLSIKALARIIRRDWGKRGKLGVAPNAMPYVAAMLNMEKITEPYGADSGESIVAYFLSNAEKWHGPIARAVKAELKRRLQ